jgi:hypothetical protein
MRARRDVVENSFESDQQCMTIIMIDRTYDLAPASQSSLRYFIYLFHLIL